MLLSFLNGNGFALSYSSFSHILVFNVIVAYLNLSILLIFNMPSFYSINIHKRATRFSAITVLCHPR